MHILTLTVEKLAHWDIMQIPGLTTRLSHLDEYGWRKAASKIMGNTESLFTSQLVKSQRMSLSFETYCVFSGEL